MDKVQDNKPFQMTESPEVILDHIYVSPAVSVIINAIEPSLVDGRFPSDHMPVIADILLPPVNKKTEERENYIDP
jgi:endonuclease/exonuclease/phosphatase family metal-dependent hydrolase